MRSGHLNLRGQGLRPGLLDVLKKEELGIELSISEVRPRTTDFIDLSTRVNNRLGQSLTTLHDESADEKNERSS